MRSTTRRRTALLASLAFAATSLGLTSSPVEAADETCPLGIQSCIIVKVISGRANEVEKYTVTPDQIGAWTDTELNSSRYWLRKNPASRNGQIDKRASIARGQRVSLNSLLKNLDEGLVGKATFTETPNRSGQPVVLDNDDLADPQQSDPDYPFLDGLPPAVFRSESGKIGYIRPLRDDTTDVNAGEYFQQTGPLVLTVHTTGYLLKPTINPSAGTSIKTKVKNTYSVTLPTTPRVSVVSTRWELGDRRDSGSKVTATYSKKGTYTVVATVRGRDGSYGRSDPLEIKVDNPPKAPSSGTGGGSGTGGLGSTGGYVPPYDPGTIDPPSDNPPAEDVPDDEPTDDIPVDDGLEEVEGYVLAGAEIVPGGTPEAIPGTQDSSQPAPATQEALRKRVATWIVAALAIALLVGAGAASETRWFRTRLHHLRRRA